jgi:thioredoxin-dependent peroxiredoxin
LRDDYEKFTDLNAEVLAISAESVPAAQAFLKSNPMPYPCVVDADHAVFDTYDVTSKLMALGQRPGLFVIDEEGKVLFDNVGNQQFNIPDNAKVLEILETARFA